MAGVYPRRLNLWLLKALFLVAHLSAAGAPEVPSPAATDGADEPACWPEPEPAWPTGTTVGADALRDEEILEAADTQKLPKEVKVFFSEVMAGLAILGHLAWRLSRGSRKRVSIATS